jgi:hypothetical protein
MLCFLIPRIPRKVSYASIAMQVPNMADPELEQLEKSVQEEIRQRLVCVLRVSTSVRGNIIFTSSEYLA